MPAAAAEDQLLGLDEEFDLADAAAPEFDSWPATAISAWPRIGVDLALHRVNVGDGRVIEIFAPDEGVHLIEKFRAEREVAGDRRAP